MHVNPDTGSYDIIAIGGGLAGLSLAIQAAGAGYKVLVIEKERYPFHRVCGEYISMESWDFIESLGLPLHSMNLPRINRLQVSALNGKLLEHPLPLGGFGISRYRLDQQMALLATRAGAQLAENSKVESVERQQNSFLVRCGKQHYISTLVLGSFGKRSNLDLKLNRSFTQQKPGKLNNYIGVKYHLEFDHPSNLISLHNFSQGYAGISQVEEGRTCFCYLTTARNLVNSNSSIPQMEEKILSRNPYLKTILRNSKKLLEAPVTISQISFDRKTQVEDHMLLAGDAAGMIAPLCGNGMSMALHASKLAFLEMDLFLNGQKNYSEMVKGYTERWNREFARRLRTGRMIQRFFGNPLLTNLLISFLKPFPRLTDHLVRKTHGNRF